ncbi:RNA polymerase 2 mediator complex subunit [Niveomyces insectorum RCEF 264]|uniref:Mediator of RNA polymerase II transcription subunit 5 n=1 Tax=Niveomyces insectorum RCEF 264 TaxID=1081102 RepID=A0A167Z3F6_9HYPO|nr:RNA polymerase 2 mediator complex subunit [Niveomyces insectorum RCEF 264]
MATDTVTAVTMTTAAAAASPIRSPRRNRPSSGASASATATTARPFVPAIRNALQWAHFLDRCLATRLNVSRFAEFARIQQCKHPVSPAVLADLCLRPPVPRRFPIPFAPPRGAKQESETAGNESNRSEDGRRRRRRRRSSSSAKAVAAHRCDAFIDPRIPAYLQVLLQRGYVDVASVLRALYRYSTSHRLVRNDGGRTASEQQHERGEGDGDGDGHGDNSNDAVMTTGDDGQGEEAKPAADAGDAHKNGSLDANDDAGGGAGASGTGGTAPSASNAAGPVYWASSYNNEETLFYQISRAVREGGAIRDQRSALLVASNMAQWLELYAAAAAACAGGNAGTDAGIAAQSQTQIEMESTRAAFVMLLLSVCEDKTVLSALAQPFAKSTRKALSEKLGNFLPLISLSSSHIAARLELFLMETLASFDPVDKKVEEETNEMIDFLDSTAGLQGLVLPELPITNSRAGLYIYLNAALVGRPLIDDVAIFSYLHNRYHGDLQTTAIDLILASFDVLANAVFRTEGQTSAHLLRSFLINKTPLLLASLAASPLYPFDSQYCISEALSRVDTNAFPTMSSMFDDNQNTNPFTDSVRQDFCFACCLHGLIPEASIETLLGEMTYQSLPAGGRHTKEQLLQQCLHNSEQMVALVGQLDNMDGNVGAVCQALVALLGHLCRTKETATLKVLCNQLVRKPLAFDVILLFERPAALLYPLAQLLDTWRYDDDQGEYQPVYEEFGAVLFLLLAFVHRYNLSIADLGIQWSPDSFVAKLLSTGHLGRSLAEITDPERENLGNWIRGLFDTDAGGLSDDLMASCPPQQFYLLTPTLFQQMVQAFVSSEMSVDVLKCGIEYLVDTFLLPSLVTALLYLSDALRFERPNEQKAIIRVLQLILQPASISHDATMMLSALLNIVAKPLEHALRTFQRQDPKNQDIDPLLRTLKENIPRSRRTGAAEHNELVTWASTSSNTTGMAGGGGGGNAGGGGVDNHSSTNGGLYAAIRQTMQGFVQWSLHPGVNIMPTSYTHRQFLAGLSLLGAPRLLQLILDEVQRQTEAGSGSVAYDVACALVCAPDVTNDASPETLYVLVGSDGVGGGGDDDNGQGGHSHGPPSGSTVPNPAAVQRRMTLRQALAYKAEEWKKMQRSRDAAEVAMAETTVRLYLKVEAQLTPPTPPPPPPPNQPDPSVPNPSDGVMAGELAALDVDDSTVAAAAAHLDDNMDMVAAAAAADSSVGAGGDNMVLDGMDLSNLGGNNGGGGGGGVGGVGGGDGGQQGGVGGLGGGDLGDQLGDLANLGDLGDLGDLGNLGGTGDGGGDIGGLDMTDQSMFGDLNLLDSFMDLQ